MSPRSGRGTISFVRLVASALVAATILVLVAAGCGGGASDEEKWAGSVCSDIATWKQQLQQQVNDARSTLQSPGGGTVDAIKTDVQQAADATKKLASDLNALGAPNTDSGAQAKQQLDSLATQLENTVNHAKQTVASLPASATTSQTVSQLSTLGPALQSLVTNTKTTLASIQSSSSDLKKGFDKADSCKQFRSSG
jgi:chromosome segregation ATPase